MTGKVQRRVDLRIDAFVERVRASYRPPLFAEFVPEFLREPSAQQLSTDSVSWTVASAPNGCGWIETLEPKLPGPLPRSYKSLVSRFLFPVLEVGPVMLFGNTGTDVSDELAHAIFRDKGIYVPLFAASYIQFGTPTTGGYDPVCFDLNRRTNAGECPVVQLDHEQLLMRGRTRIVTEVADSFLELLGS